jgi:hypothetical protein
MTHRNHNEREFEAFLAGEESELARLYRRLPQAEPDAKLDAAVLALARAAVEPQRVNALRHAKARHRRPWWLVGLSSAAGLVLAAGVAWQMRNGFSDGPSTALRPAPAGQARDVVPVTAIVREESFSEPLPPPAPAAPPAAFPAEPPAPSVDGAVAAKPAAAKKLASADDQLRKTRAAAAAAPEAEASAAAPVLAEAAADSQAKEERRQDRQENDALEIAAQQSGRLDGSPVGGAIPGASGQDKDKNTFRFAAPPPDHNSVERKAVLATGSRRDDYGLSASELADAEKAQSQPRAKADLAARMAPPPAAVAPARAAASAPVAMPAPAEAAPPASPSATTAPAPAAQAASVAQNAAGAAIPPQLQANAQLAPADWIEAIRRLLRAGSRDEAVQNLKLLREKHPDYQLPADLRELDR